MLFDDYCGLSFYQLINSKVGEYCFFSEINVTSEILLQIRFTRMWLPVLILYTDWEYKNTIDGNFDAPGKFALTLRSRVFGTSDDLLYRSFYFLVQHSVVAGIRRFGKEGFLISRDYLKKDMLFNCIKTSIFQGIFLNYYFGFIFIIQK